MNTTRNSRSGELKMPTSKDMLTVAALVTALTIARVVIQHLRHPLRKYPGPVLASMTGWYRAYYDIWRNGGFLEHLVTLHEKYGPVVRIAPNEIHFAEVDAYFDIYAIGSKFTKDPTLYRASGRDESSFGYSNPRSAKVRRAVLGPMFSKKHVAKYEPLYQAKINKMITRALSFEPSQTPVNLFRALRSVSLDIISTYSFGKCFDTLDEPGFNHNMVTSIKTAVRGAWIYRHFPIVRPILRQLPESVVFWLLPHTEGVVNMRKHVEVAFDGVLSKRSVEGEFSDEGNEGQTVYHQLLKPQPEKGHPSAPSRRSCLDEGMTLVGAGGENTGSVTTLGTFMTISQPKLMKRLQAELVEAWPDMNAPISWEALEKLPILGGVIKESLRLANCAAVPLPRDVGPMEATVNGHAVPANTIVSMGHYFVHMNPKIFPNPEQFNPDRWIGPESKNLNNYLISFSRGPRMCLGVNLAWAELYIMFANVFRKMEMEAVNTSAEDFAYRQYIIPYFGGREFHARCKAVTA